MNPQEAQQAQTIKKIKEAHEEICEYFQENAGAIPHESHGHRAVLLEIADFRAQKIEKLSAVIEEGQNTMDMLERQSQEQAQKIAEQAKEIEKLNWQLSVFEDSYDRFDGRNRSL